MEDKPHSDFDPRLMDRGWEQLRPQLDEALPVAAERRRRVAYWWWLVLGLFVLIGVGVGASRSYWNTATPAPAAPAPSIDNHGPVAATVAPAAEEEKAPAIEETEASTTVIANDQALPSPSSTSPPAPLAPSALASIHQASSDESTPPAAASPATPPAASDKAAEPASVVVAQSVTLVRSGEEQPVQETPGPALAAVDQLATLGVSPLAYRQGQPAAVAALATPIAPAPQLNYFVSGRLGTSLSGPYHSGVAVGLEGQLALSRAWQLSVGLHYHQTWPERLAGSLVAINDLRGAEDETQQENAATYDSAGRLNVSSPVLEQLYTRQLGLEVRGLVRLSPRWQVGIGGELLNYRSAYLRQSFGANPVTGFGNSVSNNFDVYDNEVQVVSSTSGEASPTGQVETTALDLNRWQWAAVAGLQYQLHAKWQLGLDWRKQLSQWSSVQPDLQTQSTLHLRLRYRLR